jgi:hypothetical protein
LGGCAGGGENRSQSRPRQEFEFHMKSPLFCPLLRSMQTEDIVISTAPRPESVS